MGASVALAQVYWAAIRLSSVRPPHMSDARLSPSLLSRLPELRPGHVWLAGAGPGDPGLLTLHALAGLAQAEVVVYDALVDARILELARPAARCVFAGKRGGKPSVDQDDITNQLIAFARQSLRVLRLKGGDPCVFGRAGEEVLKLAENGIPFRIIPGITAGLGAMAATLIPATLRGVNQAIIFATGYSANDELGGGLDWTAVARLGQPIVLYMAITRIGAIRQQLLTGGLDADTPTAVIHAATMPDQELLITTLGQLVEDLSVSVLGPPAVVIIGQIVAMRARLLELLPQLSEEMPVWLPPR
jgi:uroporphyrin-III C-methyltransferase